MEKTKKQTKMISMLMILVMTMGKFLLIIEEIMVMFLKIITAR